MHKPRQVAVAVPVYLASASGEESSSSSSPSSSSGSLLGIPPQLAGEGALFLVCSSRKHPSRYVLPKGGIEHGETPTEAALREGWEEAGFRGVHLMTLDPPIEDTRPSKPAHKSSEVPRAVYHFELVLVTHLEATWPEEHERTRRWCTWKELQELVSWRDENPVALARVPSTASELEELAKKVRDR